MQIVDRYCENDFFFSNFKNCILAGTYCLRFWASMYGKDVGSLSILTKDGTSPETLRRVFNGQQSSNWFLITEQLTLTSSDMVSLKKYVKFQIL